ncbi:MAG: S9 family peptidase [Anaerolineales bacterium]|nr:S9 family peptidase [Anaerolineales bacterium]
MDKRIIDLETLLRVPFVDPSSSFDVSPDGSLVAVAYNLSERWEIHLVSTSGDTPPKQITSGPGAKFAPSWSPDGRRLAYALDLDGGEFYDIMVYDLADESHVNLTPETLELIYPDIAWSPDGSMLALISNRTGKFDTYVMPSTGGDMRPILALLSHDCEVQWSPDGRWLAVASETTAQDTDVFIVPLNGEKPRRLGGNQTAIHAQQPRWSPDSQYVAFVGVVDDVFNIGLEDFETESIRWLTSGDGDKQFPMWSHDGKRLVYRASRGSDTCLEVLEMVNGSVQKYRIDSGVHTGPRFTPDDQSLIVIFDNPRLPPDLWKISLPNRSTIQLTRSLSPSLVKAPLVIPVEITYPNNEGMQVPALLFRPPNGEGKLPGVVYVHGGPTSLTRITWDPFIQHMVSRGWTVLAPNYRGSSGFGREWQLANRFDLGGGDTRDVVAGADFLVDQKLADAGRIAITGVSYGGYLTMTSMTRYPDRWAAGSAIVPFLNWFTVIANEREDLQHWDRENFGDPIKDRELFFERSPHFFLDRISAPVQLVCGAHDLRCPPEESINAHETLIAQGKECELWLYENEGHHFLNIENVIDYKNKRALFLARFLDQVPVM